MLIRIRALTPIWTGDINGKCTKLRETSILGSLRWWFETIVRGLDGYACDSIGELTKKCELDYKKYKTGKDPKELICPVCYIFGTTRWNRRFKLEISNNNTEKIKRSIIVKVREDKNHKGWFLGKDDSGGVLGEFTISIREIYGECKDLVALLLHLASLWGIGAKTQDGFGICEFNGDYDFDKAISQIKSLKYNNSKDNNPILPNLEDFFFAKIVIKEDVEDKIKNSLSKRLYEKVKENGKYKDKQISINDFLRYIPRNYKGQFYPTAPLIRDWLRGLFRNGNDDLRHFLFGFVSIKGRPTPICKEHLIHTIRENDKYKCKKCNKILKKEEYFEKMGSKIFVSHIYRLNDDKWEFKIWGYILKILPHDAQREEILKKLYTEITDEKSFADILGLDKDQINVTWYEISEDRSDIAINSTESLIKAILEVRLNE